MIFSNRRCLLPVIILTENIVLTTSNWKMSFIGWRFGVVVNAFVSINEVNLRRAQLVLGWVTVSGVQLRLLENLSQYITSHPGQLSLTIPPRVGAMIGHYGSVQLLLLYLLTEWHITGHFWDESLQAINCTGTDNQKLSNTTPHTPETQKRNRKNCPS